MPPSISPGCTNSATHSSYFGAHYKGMRRSRAGKAATHAKIVAVAAKRFRERGLDGIGIAEVMKESGSSVGGFYKHFNSREELVIEALAEAFKFLDLKESRSKDVSDYLDTYLSDGHRDDPGAGCALTALMSDMSRASSSVRTVYTQRLKQTFSFFTQHIDDSDDAARRARAILLFSAASGGLALARAVNDPTLAEEILDVLREQVSALSGNPSLENDVAKKP